MYSCCWTRPRSRAAKRRGHKDADAQNAERLRSHERSCVEAAGGHNLLVYSIDSPGESSRPDAAKPRAQHMPPNAAAPFKTQFFDGELLWMQRTSGQEGPYASYFSGKKRLWEARVRGRFLEVPKGDLFMGVVLRDFNYDQPVSRSSQWVKTLALSVVRWPFYLSWGDRCEASFQPDAERSHLMADLAGWDQIITTPAGEQALDIDADLTGLGLLRTAFSVQDYIATVREMSKNINTEDTYTFCFWGCSPFVDAVNWAFRFGYEIPLLPFLQEWPLHLVMYELDPEDLERDGGRHLESRKRYHLDLMFWSTKAQCPQLADRYVFLDAAKPGPQDDQASNVASWLGSWGRKLEKGAKSEEAEQQALVADAIAGA